ncbi:hypothetical protein [Streptomyces melanogenes]|uniref:hypothetical protein n=1 Tax=Streptomyces melanogenes TaxID=67326 RepID=UPI00379CA4F0
MPYETGARVKLAKDVQVTTTDTAFRIGFPGPLFLAEGLGGIVTGSAKEAGGFAQEQAALLDEQIRIARLTSNAASLIEQIRQQVFGPGAYDAGAGARIRYRVRFENGFVLDGLDEDSLTKA